MTKGYRLFLAAIVAALGSQAKAADATHYWMKIKAKDKFERSEIANLGLAISATAEDYVAVEGSAADLEKAKATGRLELSFPLGPEFLDFPTEDEKFHNYDELYDAVDKLAKDNPDIVLVEKIGKSVEERDLRNIIISTEPEKSQDKPGIVFMGGHHAREHISVEMPFLLAQKLISEYRAKNEQIVGFLKNRQINIIPSVNPDGLEYDVSGGDYHMWRKNRFRNANGTYGVDLNRNYGFMWGTGGSSKDPSSDVYMGTKPFSEPETQAIRDFVQARKNLTTLLSFHTFSELILYPWGHKYDPIEDDKGFKVHKTMAETMAKWNHYTPQQSSQLYIASGDTTDWAYGDRGIISFTFELDPTSMWEGGFYPGQDKIDVVFNKNWQPCLYLIEYADNPYRVIQPAHISYGLNSPLIN